MVIPLAVGACHLEFRVCIEVNVRPSEIFEVLEDFAPKALEIFQVLEDFAPKAREIFQVLEDFAPKAREILGFSACHLMSLGGPGMSLGGRGMSLGGRSCHLGISDI